MIQVNASLFVKQGGYTVAGFAFDLVLNENHSLESEVTQHPVEAGSAIGTHVQNKLRTGGLEGLISNWSLGSPLFLDDAWFNFVGLSAGPNRAAQTYQDVLKVLWEEKSPVDIVLGLDTYEGAIITSITANRDEESGDAQSYTLAFQELPQVQLKKTKISAQVSPAAPTNSLNRQASPTLDLGRQTGNIST